MPESDKANQAAATQVLIATAQYSAKVPTSVRYANAEAGLFIQVDISGLSPEDADNAIRAAQERIKVLVNEQVQNPEAAAVAIVQQEVPGAQVQRTAAPSGGATAGTPHTAQADNACAQCGSTSFEDFRAAKTAGTVKPRFPDFKCVGEFQGKTCGKGVWLTKKGA